MKLHIDPEAIRMAIATYFLERHSEHDRAAVTLRWNAEHRIVEAVVELHEIGKPDEAQQEGLEE